MSLNMDISTLSLSEIHNLTRLLQKAEEEQKKKIFSNYGTWFCDIIGRETLCNLPEVKSETLGLHMASKYPSGIVSPVVMTHPAVRGIMSWTRPFIAIKIEARDAETNQLVGIFVEVILKRYSLEGDGVEGGFSEDNYVTALNNLTDDGKSHSSFLYSSGGMSNKQVEAVRDLLNGKQICSPQYQSILLKMVR